MLDADDGKPMKFNIKVKVNDKVRLSESMKKNVKEIILEPHAKIIIERESIELSNDTFNKIHIYTVENNEYNLY